MRHIFDIDI